MKISHIICENQWRFLTVEQQQDLLDHYEDSWLRSVFDKFEWDIDRLYFDLYEIASKDELLIHPEKNKHRFKDIFPRVDNDIKVPPLKLMQSYEKLISTINKNINREGRTYTSKSDFEELEKAYDVVHNKLHDPSLIKMSEIDDYFSAWDMAFYHAQDVDQIIDNIRDQYKFEDYLDENDLWPEEEDENEDH